MFIVSMLTWWYTAGWRHRLTLLKRRLESTSDYFSIDLLAKTLFSPFRQISAGKVRGPIGVQLRALVDRLISRLIGGMVRSTIMLIGLVYIVVSMLVGAAMVLLWALVPLLPLVVVMLWVTGWMPWKL